MGHEMSHLFSGPIEFTKDWQVKAVSLAAMAASRVSERFRWILIQSESPRQAVKRACAECCAAHPFSIRGCPSQRCLFWRFRPDRR